MILSSFVDFYFSKERSLLALKGMFGIVTFFLPSFYFIFNNGINLSFVFFESKMFNIFLFRLFLFIKESVIFFYLKIKSRGLGYRIRRIFKGVFRFYFGGRSFIYFFSPFNILVRTKKRYMLMVSSNFFLLRLVFVNLLFLRTLVPYNLRGVFFPKQVVLLKPGKKTF